MIVVKIELHSAITHEQSNLGTLVIDNIGGTKTKGNYRCRMYRKSDKNIYRQVLDGAKPIRECEIHNHPRLSNPVQSLVLKALKEMGYED